MLASLGAAQACTTIAVGPAATTDGSVISTHNAGELEVAEHVCSPHCVLIELDKDKVQADLSALPNKAPHAMQSAIVDCHPLWLSMARKICAVA